MSRVAALLLGLIVGGLIVAIGRATTALGTAPVAAPSPTSLALASPRATPEFHPGPGFVSGRVIRLTPGGVVVDSAGRQIEVSLSGIVDVWKETSVAASAIEVGDDLFINGTDGSPFVAKYISANIGRIDGIIREIDATGMLVDVQLRQGGAVLKRIDFSPYIEYGAANIKLTREDLVVGRVIGAVIYGRPGGPLRATRIW